MNQQTTCKQTVKGFIAALSIGVSSACAATATYGKAPTISPSDPDVLSFTIYRNSYTTDEDVQRRAINEAHKVMTARGYSSYQVVGKKCSSALINKCNVQVRFSRAAPTPSAAVPSEPTAVPTPVASAPPAAPVVPRRSSTGTGFFVTDKGHILTNAHVVEGCTAVKAPALGSEELRLVRADQHNDLALLMGPSASPSYARIRAKPARAAENIIVVGFPLQGLLSSDAHVTTGVITALAGLRDDTRYVQISAPVQPGNSGGPLLDETGALVGVITSKLDAIEAFKVTGDIPQNVNFAINGSLAKGFLDALSIGYEVSPYVVKKSAADISDAAKHFTMLLECWQ